jgi:hypothetical protein
LLRRVVNRSEQAAARETRAACVGIHSDLAHPREVDYETAVAGTETSEAMTAAPDRGENSGGRGGSHGVLHVADVQAAGDESRLFCDHGVPNGTRIFVSRMPRPEQIASESPSQRRIRLFDRFRHFLPLLRLPDA